MAKSRHPMQRIIRDPHKPETVRFRANKGVQLLLNKSGMSMENLCLSTSREDFAQILQLIGYDIAGFVEHSEVSEREANKAVKRARRLGWEG